MLTVLLLSGAFLAGLVATAGLLPLVLRLAIVDGVIDLPDARRVHKIPIPRAGGVALLGGVVFATSAAMYSSALRARPFTDLRLFAAVLVGTAMIAAVGLYDDIVGLRPWQKITGQTIASIAVFLLGVRIEHISGVALPLPLDFVLTIAWFLFVTNAFNLIDGIDGLASCLGVVCCIGLLAHLLMRGANDEALVVAGLLGSLIAFLRWNLPPARLFLGDTGSNALGYLLGLLIVLACGHKGSVGGWWVPFFIVGVPFVDTVLAIWRRSVRYRLVRKLQNKKDTGVFSADLDHIHHRIARRGFNTLTVVGILSFSQLLLVLTSVAGSVWGEMWGIVPVISLGAVLLFLSLIGGLLEARLTKELIKSFWVSDPFRVENKCSDEQVEKNTSDRQSSESAPESSMNSRVVCSCEKVAGELPLA